MWLLAEGVESGSLQVQSVMRLPATGSVVVPHLTICERVDCLKAVLMCCCGVYLARPAGGSS